MIKVCVFMPAGRKFYNAQWADPVTGKKRTKSTGCAKRRDADRFAGKLQDQLNEGTYRGPSSTTWAEFRQRYETEYLSGKRDATRVKVATVFNAVETHIDPKRLASLDAEQIGKLQGKLRALELSPNTIKSMLAHLKAALRWALDKRLLREVPGIDMPENTTKAKRRSVTGEEFDRMLAAVPKVATREGTAASWERLLNGLWWSGLRISEAVALSWDDEDSISVDLSGRRPLFRIPGSKQKNGKRTLTPMAPEFAEFLQATPEAERKGFVFKPEPIRNRRGPAMSRWHVGKIVAEIGEKAGVRTGGGEDDFASAHDLRRAFGVRWSKRVMPAVLCKLMRHASMQTTMDFYNVEDAEQTADAVWDAFANTIANSDTKPQSPDEIAIDASSDDEAV